MSFSFRAMSLSAPCPLVRPFIAILLCLVVRVDSDILVQMGTDHHICATCPNVMTLGTQLLDCVREIADTEACGQVRATVEMVVTFCKCALEVL